MKRGRNKAQVTRRIPRLPFSAFSSKAIGLPPGSPVYLGQRTPTNSALSLFSYDEAGCTVEYAASSSAILDLVDPGKINWINVNGLSGGAVERICERLGVHPLVVEDILNTEHRPHVENFDHYLFLMTKMLSLHEDGDIEYEQVSFIVTDSVVVTIQETPGDCFGPIRERISTAAGRVRRSGTDYLAYALLDVIVDNYFLILEHVGDSLDKFELQAADPAEAKAFMSGLTAEKEELLRLRRILWPMRDSVASLARLEGGRMSPDLQPFLRDLQENVVQVVEAVETYREHAASILEVYLASVSNRMNEVMKVLTIISTIFIPLTFLAGVYGMNFRFMPELELRWTYPLLLASMFAIALGMVAYFKKRHWF